MVGAVPDQGGAAWAVLQYLLGFRALGWDAWFVEPAPLTSAPRGRGVLAPFACRLEHAALTTVAHWRGYGSIHHDGVHYGQKAHSLRPLFELPRRVDVGFLLALGIHPDEVADLAALTANGWRLLDPAAVAG